MVISYYEHVAIKYGIYFVLQITFRKEILIMKDFNVISSVPVRQFHCSFRPMPCTELY